MTTRLDRRALGAFGSAFALTVLAVFGVAASAAEAQRAAPPRKEVPPSRAALQYSFAPIVRRATPAVVNVYVRSTKRVVRSPIFRDPFFREFFGRQYDRPRQRVQ
ncbi:MAG: S1-C subfamily serine protease, partial [Alphaproteobacteria bacterium]